MEPRDANALGRSARGGGGEGKEMEPRMHNGHGMAIIDGSKTGKQRQFN